MSPIETRFGTRPPEIKKTISVLSRLWGETIVPSGGSMANNAWTYHADTRQTRLSHVRLRQESEVWRDNRGTQARSEMATGLAEQVVRRPCERAGLDGTSRGGTLPR